MKTRSLSGNDSFPYRNLRCCLSLATSSPLRPPYISASVSVATALLLDMKFTVAFFVLALVACAQANKATEKFRDMCVKELGLDMDLILKAEKGEFVEKEKYKCYPKCFFLKSGFISEDGKMHDEAVKAAVQNDEDRVHKEQLIEKCKNMTGEDLCDRSFAVYKCYFTGLKDHKH